MKWLRELKTNCIVTNPSSTLWTLPCVLKYKTTSNMLGAISTPIWNSNPTTYYFPRKSPNPLTLFYKSHSFSPLSTFPLHMGNKTPAHYYFSLKASASSSPGYIRSLINSFFLIAQIGFCLIKGYICDFHNLYSPLCKSACAFFACNANGFFHL